MAEDWRRVGAAIERRIAALGLTKAEVSRLSAVSDVTLNKYIAGQPVSRTDKARGLATALRWTLDSFDRIAAGGEPEEVPTTKAVGDELAEIRDQLNTIEKMLRDLTKNRH